MSQGGAAGRARGQVDGEVLQAATAAGWQHPVHGNNAFALSGKHATDLNCYNSQALGSKEAKKGQAVSGGLLLGTLHHSLHTGVCSCQGTTSLQRLLKYRCIHSLGRAAL